MFVKILQNNAGEMIPWEAMSFTDYKNVKKYKKKTQTNQKKNGADTNTGNI